MLRDSLLLVMLTFVCHIFKVQGQPPCYVDYGSLYMSTPLPSTLPPVTTSMPYEVLIGHIGMDSLTRILNPIQIDSFIVAQNSINDTIEGAWKFGAHLLDYNPLELRGISMAASPHSSRPLDIYDALRRLSLSYSPYPNIDAAIFASSYISIVDITSITDTTDSSAYSMRDAILANGEVLDTILGRVFPICPTYPLSSISATTPPAAKQCIVFDTRWERMRMFAWEAGHPTDSSDIDALMPSLGKYLVFLRIEGLCVDSTNAYFKISPTYWATPTFGLYQIDSNNKIVDAENFFGLGTNPDATDVANAIKSRITALKTWSN